MTTRIEPIPAILLFLVIIVLCSDFNYRHLIMLCASDKTRDKTIQYQIGNGNNMQDGRALGQAFGILRQTTLRSISKRTNGGHAVAGKGRLFWISVMCVLI